MKTWLVLYLNGFLASAVLAPTDRQCFEYEARALMLSIPDRGGPRYRCEKHRKQPAYGTPWRTA